MKKGAFDGILIQSMRGMETVFSDLGKDFFAPSVDTPPPLVAGQAELRRYRFAYLVRDEMFGDFSDIVQIVAAD